MRVLTLLTSEGRLHAVWPAPVSGHVRAMPATLVSEPSSVGFTLPLAPADGAIPTTTRLADERALIGSRVAYDPSTGTPLVVRSEGVVDQGYRVVAWRRPPGGSP